MKYWCLCKTFNDHLNCVGVIAVRDKLHCYNHTLYEMFVTSNGFKRNTGIPKKELNKEKSEPSQICSTMKKQFYKNLTNK